MSLNTLNKFGDSEETCLKDNGEWLIDAAEISWLLAPSMGKAPKTLDPKFPISQLDSFH